MLMFALVSALTAVLTDAAMAAPPTPPPFQDGDIVCFVGDSITHSRKYTPYIYDYYLTRFPERHIRFVNCGIAGDSAGGAVRRLDWDILPNRPTVASIMLGMNDVSRGLYGKENPSEQILASRKTALDNYQRNMDALAAALAKSGARLIFLTPSIYDQTAQLATENLFGVNDALAECGRMGQALAEKYGGTGIDFHGPMTALNAELQKTDPAFTLVGPDRVHPGDPGMLVMAYLYLKAQGLGPTVSRVVVDAAAESVETADNCTVSNLSVENGYVVFDLLERALPWPVENTARAALAWVPAEADLNQETLAVKLPGAGEYVLRVDGRDVGRFSAAQLAAGVNLALNDQMPQVKQAQEVQAANLKRHATEVRLRSWAQVKLMLLSAKVDENDEDAVKAYFTSFLARVTTNNAYYASQFANYQKTRLELEPLRADLERQTKSLWTLNQPRSHHYELAPVAP
jgi:lysophospholipase L1-like esterase